MNTFHFFILTVTPSLQDLLVKYFTQFGNKWCCFDDLRNFVTQLDKTAAVQLVTLLQEKVAVVGEDETSVVRKELVNYYFGVFFFLFFNFNIFEYITKTPNRSNTLIL